MSVLNVIELVVAGLFALGGIRSFWIWSRRPIDSTHLRDQLSYALYRTGRIGLWFAVAGMFVLSSTLEGRAVADEFHDHRWYLMIPLILAIMQFVGGYLLGRSTTKRPATVRTPEDDEA